MNINFPSFKNFRNLKLEFKLFYFLVFFVPVTLSFYLAYSIILNTNKASSQSFLQEQIQSKECESEFVKDRLIVKLKAEASKIADSKLKSQKTELSLNQTQIEELFPEFKSSLLNHNQNNQIEFLKMEPLFKESKQEGLMSNLTYQQRMEKLANQYPQRAQRHFAEKNFIDMDTIYIVTLTNPTENIVEIAQTLSENHKVEYAEPDYIVNSAFIPNDTYFPIQWPLHNVSQNYPIYQNPDSTGTLDADIDAPEAWDINQGDGVVIAIIDTGVDYTHKDLGGCTYKEVQDRQCSKIVPGYDFVNLDDDPMDDNGHGTHCAGIAAAIANNNYGIAGAAPNAKIMPIKFLSECNCGSLSNAILSINFAIENGADIISNSWSGSYSHSLNDIIQNAYSQGIAIIASAGNYDSLSREYPASLDNVISVAALDANDLKASFSSYGAEVDISAPGEHILSLRAKNTGGIGNPYSENEEFSIASGTSMACPYVSGVMALAYSQFPTETNSNLYFRLKVGADDIYEKNPQYQNLLGEGRVNAQKTLSSSLLETPFCQIDDVNQDKAGSFTIKAWGYGDKIRLFLQRKDGQQINNSSLPLPSIYSGRYSYNLLETTDNEIRYQLNDLSPEEYFIHCDVIGTNDKCSGNPICDFKGGDTNCSASGWRECSNQDYFDLNYENFPTSFLIEWGGEGSDDIKFEAPESVAIDSQNNIYVTDSYNHYIQKFSTDGQFLARWGGEGFGDGQFDSPLSIAIDSQNNVYVADSGNHRIQKFTADGQFLAKWGSYGSNDGQFKSPKGIAFDSQNNIYITDISNHRIQKFTADGQFLAKWGDYGSNDGQFMFPRGIAIDSQNNVYVADSGNHRIQKFTADGQFLAKWGSWGSGDGQFNFSYDIAIDSQNNVYVADISDHRIQKFTTNGQFLTKWGDYGSDDGQFDAPKGIAIDSQNNIYVADTYNNRIQKFTADGQFLTKWLNYSTNDGKLLYPSGIVLDSQNNIYVTDSLNNRIQKFNPDGQFITKWGSKGSGDGQFNAPLGIAIDSQNNIYVADTYNHRIQKFTADGQFITKWGSFSYYLDGQFENPKGIAIDSQNNIYVVDTYNHRIQKFTADGQFLAKWGNEGSDDGQFDQPHGIAIDSRDNIYVIDSYNYRIQKFNVNGQFLAKFGGPGSSNGQLIGPRDIAFDSQNNIYVTDTYNDRIQKFNSFGKFVAKWGSEGFDNGQFVHPYGIVIDSQDNVYVTDTDNDRIQKFALTIEDIQTGFLPCTYCDTDQDNDIDKDDLNSFKNCYGKTVPDGSSCDNLDIKLDGIINILDLVRCAGICNDSTISQSTFKSISDISTNYSCSKDGKKVTLSWDNVSNAKYAVRLNNLNFVWTGCNPNQGDLCSENLTTNSKTFDIKPETEYSWWIHVVSDNGEWNETKEGEWFKCESNLNNINQACIDGCAKCDSAGNMIGLDFGLEGNFTDNQGRSWNDHWSYCNNTYNKTEPSSTPITQVVVPTLNQSCVETDLDNDPCLKCVNNKWTWYFDNQRGSSIWCDCCEKTQEETGSNLCLTSEYKGKKGDINYGLKDSQIFNKQCVSSLPTPSADFTPTPQPAVSNPKFGQSCSPTDLDNDPCLKCVNNKWTWYFDNQRGSSSWCDCCEKTQEETGSNLCLTSEYKGKKGDTNYGLKDSQIFNKQCVSEINIVEEESPGIFSITWNNFSTWIKNLFR